MDQKRLTIINLPTQHKILEGGTASGKWFFVFLSLFLLFTNIDLKCLTVGSNSACAIEAFVSFPETGTDNTMLGFGRFSNGFGLVSANTTCTFNDLFPIGGPIYLNGGTLYLQEDLACSASTYIYTGGTINAQKHSIILDNTSNSTMPIMAGVGGQAFVMTTATPRTFTVQSIGWSYDDQYFVIVNPGFLNVYYFNGYQLIYENSVSLQSTLSCRWHPNRYLWALGQMYLGGANLRLLTYIPPTSFGTPSTVYELTTVHTVAWNPTGTYLLDSTESTTFKVYSFNLTTSVLSLKASYTSGYPMYDAVYGIYNNVSWSSTSSYFAATSTDTAHAALAIYSFNGSVISPVVSVTTDRLPSAVSWSPTSSFIAVSFDDATPTANWLRIYQFTPPSTLTQVLSYPSTPTGFATAVSWNRDGTQLACGVFSNGVNTFNTYAFNPSPPTITPVWTSASLPNYIASCDWAHSGNYLAAGAANSGLATIYAFNSPHRMVLKDASLQISGNIYLNTPPMLFQGHCVLNGNNCNLYLGGSGITVDSGASLLIKDLSIYNIIGTNISCVDNTSTISFCNVTWHQDNDFTFTLGQLAITAGKLDMTGGHRFIYQSDQPVTVYNHATWSFDNGMTFSYCPTLGETNLINFQSSNATLYLYGTNLYAVATGLRLTKGCLMIDGPCQFMSDGFDETHGIWIGDGTAADDLKVNVLAESGIVVEKGYVSYRNTK